MTPSIPHVGHLSKSCSGTYKPSKIHLPPYYSRPLSCLSLQYLIDPYLVPCIAMVHVAHGPDPTIPHVGHLYSSGSGTHYLLPQGLSPFSPIMPRLLRTGADLQR